MIEQPSSRRHFLKELGLVTGAFATGTFVVNSSASAEIPSYDDSSSGSCVPIIDWHPIITRISDTEYRATYNYVGIYKGEFIRSSNPTYLGTYPSHTEASNALSSEYKKVLEKITKE